MTYVLIPPPADPLVTSLLASDHDAIHQAEQDAITDLDLRVTAIEVPVVVSLMVSDMNGDALNVLGTGRKTYFRVPSVINGKSLTAVSASLDTQSSSGNPSVQLIRNRNGSEVNMLSTVLSIDSGEKDSNTASVPAVINSSNDDVVNDGVVAADRIIINLTVTGTGAKGLLVELQFT